MSLIFSIPTGSYSRPISSISFLSSEVGFDGDSPVRTECSRSLTLQFVVDLCVCLHLQQPLTMVAEDSDLGVWQNVLSIAKSHRLT